MIKFLLAFSASFLLVTALNAQSICYELNGDFNAFSGTDPVLAPVGSGTGSFVSDPLLGGEMVYKFSTDAGLTFDNSSGIASGDYSIELYFKFDHLGNWSKIIDYNNRMDAEGLFSETMGRFTFFDEASSSFFFAPGVYAHVVVSRDFASGVYKGYVNGVEVFQFTDTGNLGLPGASNVLHFFIDDNPGVGTETLPGAVRAIRIYGRVLSPGEIAGLASHPLQSPCVVAIPTMSEWGLFILFLLMLSYVGIALLQSKTRLALADNSSSSIAINIKNLPFQRNSFFRMFSATLIGTLAIFAVCLFTFGYEMTITDVIGTAIAAPIFAYLAHLLFWKG